MNEAGDDVLVRTCLDGDPRAFEELLARYHRQVYNVALRMLRSIDDAQDVTQAVFLKAYENLGTYDSTHKFYSWIYRIAVNESINAVRRKRRDTDLLDDGHASPDPGPDIVAGAEQLGAGIRAAMGELTPEYRAVIVLKYFLGCSYAEIAEILEVEEKTVKSRLFTARQRLKDLLVERAVV